MKVHHFDPSSNTPALPRNTVELQPQTSFFHRNRFILLILLFVMVVWSAVVAVVYIYTNCTRIIDFPELKIYSITVSNFNLSSNPNQISADWNVKMNLKNKDAYGYYRFSDISVSIYYNVLQFGLINLMPVDITPHNSTKHFDETLSGSSRLNGDSIVSALSADVTAGKVTVDVQFQASARKSFRGRWYDHTLLAFKCNVELFFGSKDKSRAQMLNSYRKCKSLPTAYDY